ncbi:MAG: UDP-N-acetylmuramoyl-L-alanine--D-glutamate ligase [Pseudomonadales bacterium]
MSLTSEQTLPVFDYSIIGVGATGLSCARYLQNRGDSFSLCDTRSKPPGAADVLREFAGIDIYFGELPLAVLKNSKRLLVSPGVSLETHAIRQVLDQGVSLCSDLDLFRAEIKCPVVCVTGSNGKSTVATLLAEIAKAAEINVCLCGNIGLPVLDALDDSIELYVLEVSSFQLERSAALAADAATILNISADHMDRYSDLESYASSKQRVFMNADKCIINRDELACKNRHGEAYSSFGFSEPAAGLFGVAQVAGDTHLMYGDSPLLPTSEMRLQGTHNVSNALAALALAQAIGISLEVACGVLRKFAGLPHRCEHIADIDGRSFINDSKGTNVGATVAALEGLGTPDDRRMVLIAGGVGKGADFSELSDAVSAHAHSVLVYGQDAEQIADALETHTEIHRCNDLAEAVNRAYDLSAPCDTVLFSPACASFDMFDNFEQRGDRFRELVLSFRRKTSASGVGQ